VTRLSAYCLQETRRDATLQTVWKYNPYRNTLKRSLQILNVRSWNKKYNVYIYYASIAFTIVHMSVAVDCWQCKIRSLSPQHKICLLTLTYLLLTKQTSELQSNAFLFTVFTEIREHSFKRCFLFPLLIVDRTAYIQRALTYITNWSINSMYSLWCMLKCLFSC
jgi:hypothetical protein